MSKSEKNQPSGEKEPGTFIVGSPISVDQLKQIFEIAEETPEDPDDPQARITQIFLRFYGESGDSS